MTAQNPIEILTERLVIRTPRVEDARAITEAKIQVWHNLQLWMSWAHNGEETLKATERFIQNAVAQNFLIGICRKTGEFVISTGINPTAGQERQFETGYWVAPGFLKQGYATEATNAVIRYGFNVLAAQSVYICHFEGNEPSRRVIEKLGFAKTGIREKAHKCCFNEAPLDVHEYIMRDPSVLPPLHVEWRPRCP